MELFNSSYIIGVNVPDNGREITVAIPDGLTPVKVIDRNTQAPIAQARVAWVGTTGRVEALATPNGDALLEAVGAKGGTLTISDRGYQTLEGAFEVTPAKGVANFSGIDPGALNFTAYADGFAPTTLQVSDEARASIRIVVPQRKD